MTKQSLFILEEQSEPVMGIRIVKGELYEDENKKYVWVSLQNDSKEVIESVTLKIDAKNDKGEIKESKTHEYLNIDLAPGLTAGEDVLIEIEGDDVSSIDASVVSVQALSTEKPEENVLEETDEEEAILPPEGSAVAAEMEAQDLDKQDDQETKEVKEDDIEQSADTTLAEKPENKDPEKEKRKKTWRNCGIAVVVIALAAGVCYAFNGTSQVTVDNAPNDFTKSVAALQDDPAGSDVLAVLNTMIDNTMNAYNYQIVLDQKTDGTTLTTDDDGSLATTASSGHIVDVRYGTDTTVYELFEQAADDQQMGGLMEADAAGSTTAFTTYESGTVGDQKAEMQITSVSSAEDSSDEKPSNEEVQQLVKNTVVYPLYSLAGQNLILQPTVNPEYYNFSFVKKGSDYILTLSMKDHDEYNEYLDNFVSQNYGYDRTDIYGNGSVVVDVYDTTDVTLTYTMDENGVLKSIVSSNKNQIGSEDDLLNVNSTQTVTISPADETYGDMFATFFAGVKDGTLKEGDVFSVETGQKVEEETTEKDSSETADSDTKQDDSQSTTEDEKDQQTANQQQTDSSSNEENATTEETK